MNIIHCNSKKFAPILLLMSFLILVSCQNNSKINNEIFVDQMQLNTRKVDNQPTVILISLDGFRWDYVERFNPPHLSAFIKSGVKADSLIPSFPSKTFPNHYSIATGMNPDSHNIVGNTFYDYELGKVYSINNKSTVENGAFYRGTPLWVLAAKSGINTASFFFVGSEAKIKGIRPRYFYNYEESIPNSTRINQAVQWLSMPKDTKPHLITLYFSDMDDIGHDFGPNDDEKLHLALMKLDSELAVLFNTVNRDFDNVNIIIVSDHGMREIPLKNYIPSELITNNDNYFSLSNGSIINIHPKNKKQTQVILKKLQAVQNLHNYKAYLTPDTPGFEHKPKNKNWGSIQVVANKGHYFLSVSKIEEKKASSRTLFGHHGFDPLDKQMHGIFYAKGPAFKKSLSMPSVKNIHIFPLICEILGLKIPRNIDGKLNQLASVLIDH